MGHFGILTLVSLSICDCPTAGVSTPHSSQCYNITAGTTVTLNKNFFINIASGSGGGGGAVRCQTLIATECCFRNCTVTGSNWGGAIYASSSGSSCARLVGESCSAFHFGFLYSGGSGSLTGSWAELQIFRCLANTGNVGANSYAESSSTSTSNFTSCYAGGHWGVIRVSSGSCTISGCFFFNCSEGSGSGSRGAIGADIVALVVVTRSIFLDCNKGPGACYKSAELRFQRCAFEGSEFLAPPADFVRPNVSKCLFSDAISAQIVDKGGNQAHSTANSAIVGQVVVAEACDYFERVLILDTPSAPICLSDGALQTRGFTASGVGDTETFDITGRVVEAEQTESFPVLETSEESKSNLWTITGAVVASLVGLALLLGLLLFLLCRRAKTETGSEDAVQPEAVVHPAWEVPEDQVTQTNPMAASEEIL